MNANGKRTRGALEEDERRRDDEVDVGDIGRGVIADMNGHRDGDLIVE